MMQRRIGILTGIAFFFFTLPALSQEITQNVVTLLADDGGRIPAILMYPATGINTHNPGVVLLHAELGGHPMRGRYAPRWAAEHMARLGYTTLSPVSRHSTGRDARTYRAQPFETVTIDTKAAIDFLAQLGAQDIVLAGHGVGSMRISRYMADTQDSRVKAMIHYSPSRDMPDWMRANMGKERYLNAVDRFSTMVSEGRGDDHILEVYELSQPAPPGQERELMQTARTWLNWWSPASLTRNTVAFKDLHVPQLLLAGDKDKFVTLPYMEELKASAANAPGVELRWYEGGVDHEFSGARTRAPQDTTDWLASLGLGSRPDVITHFVDTVADDGHPLSAVFYTPADNSAKGKATFMMFHGYAGGIMWSPNHWLCVRLAQAGHACLAPETRGLSTDALLRTMEEETPDFKAWVDWLENEGYDKMVLAGHSWGGIRISHYMAEQQDPRVKGMIYLAPTIDAAESVEKAMGQDAYRALVAKAESIVASGKPDVVVAVYEQLPPAKPNSITVRPQSARSFLSHWGPNANTVHTEQIRKVNVPILSLAGNEDMYVDLPFLKKFTRAAGGEAEYRWYDDGGTHSFRGFEQRTAKDILEWAERVIERDS